MASNGLQSWWPKASSFNDQHNFSEIKTLPCMLRIHVVDTPKAIHSASVGLAVLTCSVWAKAAALRGRIAWKQQRHPTTSCQEKIECSWVFCWPVDQATGCQQWKCGSIVRHVSKLKTYRNMMKWYWMISKGGHLSACWHCDSNACSTGRGCSVDAWVHSRLATLKGLLMNLSKRQRPKPM